MVAVRAGLRLGLLFSLMVVLSGCMEALHIDQPGSLTPSPVSIFQSPTSLMTASATATVTEATSVAGEMQETVNSVGGLFETVTPTTNATEGPQTVTPSVTQAPLPSPQPSPVEITPTTTTTPTTVVPTPTLTPTVPTPTPTPEFVIVPPTLPAVSYAERWRAQQDNREVFEPPALFTTSGSELWWYDPVNQQHVMLGSFAGDFEAQAQFQLVGQGVPALEVAYHVNQSYGLTAISSSLIERIRAAGYDEWIDTYVILTPEVRPRQAF